MATTAVTPLARYRYQTPLTLWLWFAAGLLLSIVVAREGAVIVKDNWFTRPEYSHGVLIPFIAAFLVWQRRDALRVEQFAGSWIGFGVAMVGLSLWLLGKVSTIYAVSQYALVVMFYGVIWALIGTRLFARLWAPMLMLMLMIPLPAFFYNNLSFDLQLMSSAFGVWLMRLFGISVYLSGNVIDLGHFQMQVVEACDGLRYLFPLMTLGFVVAYFFQGALWQRVAIFLSSIPITIFMNSARIAMIGVFADYGNTALAEGLLHELQGWAIFMVSGALLLAETWLLTKVFIRGRGWRDVLGLDRSVASVPRSGAELLRSVPVSSIVVVIVFGIAATLSYALPGRTEQRPVRSWFVDFPRTIDEWTGTQKRIDDIYLDALKVDDYLMADYRSGEQSINLYVAYYASQRSGNSVHSPRSCIPGGGWTIREFDVVSVPRAGGGAFGVNRALIELGNQRQLVYYWFKQRDRHLTNEYLVKWFLFVDALTRQRTDGALVRVIAPLSPGERIEGADQRLATFASEAESRFGPYVPD